MNAEESKLEVIETILEDYKRRLETANKMIDELQFKDDANPDYVRLTTKASCYRTFISEYSQRAKNIN